jgi:hypothetical protein
MERGEVVGPKRRQRVHRSIAERRRIRGVGASAWGERGACGAGRSCEREPGVQVRREYRNRLVEAGESATSLLPVVVSATSFEAGVALSAPVCPEPAAPTGAIHIEFPGRAKISVENGADGSLPRTILESLRQ